MERTVSYGLYEIIDGNDEVALTQLAAAGEIHAARSRAKFRSRPISLEWMLMRPDLDEAWLCRFVRRVLSSRATLVAGRSIQLK